MPVSGCVQRVKCARLDSSAGILTPLIICLLASMGAIFGCATCLSTQMRDAPDDPLNFFVGGCASGIFLGARSE